MRDALMFDPETHIYSEGERRLPSVTQIIKEAGMIDGRWYTEYGSTRGSFAHSLCEFYDQGDLDEGSVDLKLRPYLDAWIKFRQDTGFNPIYIEYRLSSRLGFAGTLDRAGTMQGGDWIIDIKTAAAIHWTTGIQIAAYKLLLEEAESKRPYRRMAVQLKPNGTYTTHPFTALTDKSIFLSALSVANARINAGEFWRIDGDPA